MPQAALCGGNWQKKHRRGGSQKVESCDYFRGGNSFVLFAILLNWRFKQTECFASHLGLSQAQLEAMSASPV